MKGSKYLMSEKEGKDTLLIITRLYFSPPVVYVMELTHELWEALDLLTEVIMAVKINLPFPVQYLHVCWIIQYQHSDINQ